MDEKVPEQEIATRLPPSMSGRRKKASKMDKYSNRNQSPLFKDLSERDESQCVQRERKLSVSMLKKS